MVIIPNQPFGIGDVIFTQTLIHKLYIEKGQKVLWPVFPHYVAGLNIAYPQITFINWEVLKIDFTKKTDQFIGDMHVIPLRFNDVPVATCMKRKYTERELPWECWKENAQYRRDKAREKRLYDLLNPKDESFNLISETFQADFKGTSKITVDNGLKNINVTTIEGYSLFDWSLLMEKATYIYAVASSNVYLFELLNLQAREIHLFKRLPRERNHDNYSYILKSHNYILE